MLYVWSNHHNIVNAADNLHITSSYIKYFNNAQIICSCDDDRRINIAQEIPSRFFLQNSNGESFVPTWKSRWSLHYILTKITNLLTSSEVHCFTQLLKPLELVQNPDILEIVVKQKNFPQKSLKDSRSSQLVCLFFMHLESSCNWQFQEVSSKT